MIEIRPRLH